MTVHTEKFNISTTATDEKVNVQSGTGITVALAAQQTGTLTAGTIAFQALVPGSATFEPITDSGGADIGSIDVTAPISVTIEQPIAQLSFTVTGASGSVTQIDLAYTKYDK